MTQVAATARFKLMRAETKVISLDRGEIHAILSTESKDRDGDIIRAAGWDLEDFLRHPVLLSSHNYGSLRSQIGYWSDVKVVGQRLEGVAHYLIGEGNDEADWAFKLATKGLAAYSVGFISDSEKVKELDGGKGFEFNGQKLLEASQVTVPSNADALQRMKGMKGSGMNPVLAELLDEVEQEDQGHVDALADAIWERMKERLALPTSKRAIASHSTDTSEHSWDAGATERRLSNDAGEATYRKAYAWVDPDGDAETKGAHRFIHHEVNGEGSVGAANLSACFAGIAVLNDGRGGADIPGADRQGIWNHLARHLRDDDKEPQELRGALVALQTSILPDWVHTQDMLDDAGNIWTPEEVFSWLQS